MWINIPVLKNTWTGEVEEMTLNMDYCTRVTTYVHDTKNTDLSVCADDEKKSHRALTPMKTCLFFEDGTWLYSPWARDDVAREMRKAQNIAITPSSF